MLLLQIPCAENILKMNHENQILLNKLIEISEGKNLATEIPHPDKKPRHHSSHLRKKPRNASNN